MSCVILRVHLAQKVTFITFVILHIFSTNSLIFLQTLMLPCLGAESQEVHRPFSLFEGKKRGYLGEIKPCCQPCYQLHPVDNNTFHYVPSQYCPSICV